MHNRIGTIYIVAAPSGTGKTTLVAMLTESLEKIKVSISHTTREMRIGERNGENYYFIDEKKFKQMIKNNEFLEYANVFGNYYGTTKKRVLDQINNGIDVILEIDVQGFKQIKKQLPNVVSIFILPPSFQELKKRLKNRARDSQDVINKRLQIAHKEMSHIYDFDYIVVNDKFDIALVDLRSIIRSHRLLKNEQLTVQKKLLTNLMKEEK